MITIGHWSLWLLCPKNSVGIWAVVIGPSQISVFFLVLSKFSQLALLASYYRLINSLTKSSTFCFPSNHKHPGLLGKAILRFILSTLHDFLHISLRSNNFWMKTPNQHNLHCCSTIYTPRKVLHHLNFIHIFPKILQTARITFIYW